MSRALEGGDVPNDLVYLIVLKFVVNPVRPYYDVIKGLRSIGLSDDLRHASDTVWNAAVGWDLGLSVAKRSANTQPARENAIRTDKRILFILAVILWRLLNLDLVNHVRRHTVFDNSLGLVNVPACLYQSVELRRVRRLVIMADLSDLGAEALALLVRLAADSPRVSNVDDVDEVVNHQNYNCARATFVHALIVLKCHLLEELLFCLFGRVLDGQRNVGGEVGRQNYVVVEVVFDELGAFVASVAVEHAEDLDFGPVLDPWIFRGGLDHVQDNRNPVFIRFPYSAYVRIRSETFNRPKAFSRHFGRLKLLEHRRLFVLRALDQFLNLLLQDRVLVLFWGCLRWLLLLDCAHDLELCHLRQVRRLRSGSRLLLLACCLLHVVWGYGVAATKLWEKLPDSWDNGLHEILAA